MASGAADCFAVMDADLQHDERILPQMISALADDPNLELAVGTRFASSGGFGNWPKNRQLIRRLASS